MKVFIVAALLVVAAAENYFRLPTPYSFGCKEGLCVRELNSQSQRYNSLSSCQLTCGQYGSIWPKPTGEVKLSPETVSFSPINMRVRKVATSDSRVARMLNNAIQHFTRNIHFLHPEYPQSEKQPMTFREFEQLRRIEQQQYEDDQQYRQRSSPDQQTSGHQSASEYQQQPIRQQQQFRQRQRFGREEPETYVDFSPFFSERSTPGVERQRLNIEITVTTNDRKLKLDTDESYNLVIQTADDQTTATILATTYFGARHALETLSQLIAYDDINNAVQIVKDAQIRDEPSFQYRGFMLDTARNFYPKEDLMQLLDSMAYNKLNYFHWHITDAAAFPMYSSRNPKMTYYGAYDPRKVYYPEDIKDIVEYANLRGIAVIPELNGPAHSAAGWQWGEEEGKGKLAICTGKSEPWFERSKEPPAGHLNPVNRELYQVLGELYRDFMDYFDPEMVHMGGDDVSFKCWQSSEEIKQYFAANKIDASSREYFELWNTYQTNAYGKLQEAAEGRKVTPILYSSSFARNYVDKESYIIQITENADDTAIADYVNNGYRVIFSNQDQWNLDCVTNTWIGDKAATCPQTTPNWEIFYRNSPLDILYNQGINNARTSFNENILGGEATLQSFETDRNGLFPRMWPRVSAFAERLWTDPTDDQSIDSGLTQKRLNIQRQRMVFRGIQADALQPEYCMQDESVCVSKEQFRARSPLSGISGAKQIAQQPPFWQN